MVGLVTGLTTTFHPAILLVLFMPNVIKEEKKLESIELTIEVSVLELLPYLAKAAEALSREKPISGWRPGKVDVKTAESVYGEKTLYEASLNFIVRDTLPKIVIEKNIKFIGEPSVAAVTCAPGSPVVYKAEFTLYPEVKIGDVSKIKLKRKSAVVSDEEIENTITYLRNSRANEALVNRASKSGDRVVFSLEVYEDNVPLNVGGKEWSAILGSSYEAWPGMEEKLIDLKSEDLKEFSLKMPDTFYIKKLSGKTLLFKVVVKSVFERTLPEANDDFAHSLGNFPTLASLRDALEKNITSEKNAEEEARLERELIKALVSLSVVSFIPKNLLTMEKEQMLFEQKRMVEGKNLSWNDYLLHLNSTEEVLKNGFEEGATFRLKRNFILAKFIEDRKISVTDGELEEEWKIFSQNETAFLKSEGGQKENQLKLKAHLNTYILQKKAIETLLKETVAI